MKRLVRDGAPLWRRLIECFQPDILLSSIAWKWMNDCYIELEPCGSWEVIHALEKKKDCSPRSRPVKIKARWHAYPAGNQVLFADEPAAQTPLGPFKQRTETTGGTQNPGTLAENDEGTLPAWKGMTAGAFDCRARKGT